MSVSYKGLLRGNHNPIEVMKVLAHVYGGDHYHIRFGSESTVDFGYGLGPGIDQGNFYVTFDEEFSDEVKALRPWERKPHRIGRQMGVYTDGCCKSDYEGVESGPMTYISLGHWGQCKEIVNRLVAHFGGYVYDEAGADEWVLLEGDDFNNAVQASIARNKAREEANARHLAKRKAEEAADQ